MLRNKETNVFIPVVMEVDDTLITDDGIILNKDYKLVWTVDGEEKTFTHEYDGETLTKYAVRGINLFVENTGITDLMTIRRETGIVASLWSTLKINPKLFRKAVKNHPKHYRELLKRAKNGNRECLEMMRWMIAAYLYLKMMWREEEEEEYTTLVMKDFMEASDEYMEGVKDGWEDAPMTKNLNIKSWEEYKIHLGNGVMYGNFVPNLDDVTIH
jgi:hypothetical protein